MWIERKRIKGREYLYLRWRENGRQHSRYLGPAESTTPHRIIDRLQSELDDMRARQSPHYYDLYYLIQEIREHGPGRAP